MYFDLSPDKPKLVDVFDLKIYFLRPTIAAEISIHIQDVLIAKKTSTVVVKLLQGGKLNFTGLVTCVESSSFLLASPAHRNVLMVRRMGDFNSLRGVSIDTGWSLMPKPAEASIPQLATDSDPRWISYQCPWSPQGYRRPQSYVKFYVPFEFRDPSFRDCWLTPSDQSLAFKSEHLGFVGDMTLPILDNFYGERGMGSHAACVAAGLEQKRNRERGIVELADSGSGSFTTPIASVTLSLNLEVKQRLPPEGVKWLFSRCRAKQIQNGRMDNEIVILDEHGQLIALVQQVHQLVDLPGPQDSKL